MAAPPFKVRALYEYASEHDDDLKFKEGQVIQVTEEEGDDWYVGEYADAAGTRQEGLFPRNFVEKVEPEVPQRPARSGRPKSGVVSSPPPPQPPPSEEEGQGQEAESKGIEPEEPDVPSPPVPAASKPEQQQPPPIDPLAASNKQADNVTSPPSATQPPPPSPPAPQADARAESPPASKTAAEPAASQSAKAAPPPVAPKSNAFKDRIAAFNKPEAAPIAPMNAGKPQRNDYIKKPFVAPPPSKNAYVPPVQKQEPVQKPYIREEDPEIKQRQEDDHKAAEAAGLTGESEPPSKSAGGEAAEDEEDAPKPMTLKERMALLQREQEAQRARQAEASQKKKPPVKRASESEHGETGENEEPRESVRSPGSERQSLDVSRERPRGTSGQRRSEAPMSPVQAVPEHEILSGGEEADQSAAGDMTEDDSGTLGGGPEEAEDKHPPSSSGPQVPSRSGSGVGTFPIPQAAPRPPARESSVGGGDGTTAGSRTADDQEAEGEEEEEEEEEVDEEEARKQRLRERMARLAGGQGAGAPFNPFGAPPPMAPPKKKSSTKERKETGEDSAASPRQEQVPQMIAIPGMAGAPPVPGRDKETVTSPEAVSRTSTGEMGGAEDEAPLSPPPRRSTQEEPSSAPTPPRRSMQEEGRPMSGGAPPVPKDRPVPPRPGASAERGAPPPPPSDSSRPTPRPPPAESRPVPPPPSAGAASQQPPMSPAPGYQTDDEMSMQDQRSSTGTPGPEAPLPIRTGGAPPVPSREQPMSPSRQRTSGYFGSEPSSANSDKRSSRPPIPGTQPQSPSVTSPRPPPPPPPGGAPTPPSRQGTDLSTQEQDEDETERGESDYEGDYDTDIASSAKHKDALKSGHARQGSLDDSTTTGDEGTPVSTPGPAPATAAPSQPRAVPPPPPGRPSVDAPRAPPPAPPPAREPTASDEGEYDPYNYNASGSSAAPARAPPPPVPGAVPVAAPPIPPEPSTEKEEVEESSADDMPGPDTPSLPAAPNAPVSRKSMERPPPPPPGSASGAPPMPSRTSTRQSLDVGRQTSMGRKSMDAGRPSGDQLGQIAGEIDLAPESMWWTNPDPLPPVLANRNGLDILSESEESQKSRRGGRTTVSKDVYVLYMDYSQTVITAQYDAKDPVDCSLEQRHESPPPRLRQDQLEAYWGKFGRAIAKAASELASGGGGGSSSSSSKKDTTVGEGRPENLPLELIKRSAGKDALLPVGVRAYGALVYANLANASTMQYDEIRPGDILTLRNAKFEGHHGALKQRYKSEYGMQGSSGSTAGHVAVVEEWDGTRRSVRAWEQGREREGKERKAGGVRSEKFRLGDLRSGEVRVWRVVGRDWVGWAE